jgi:hypothetical protein
VTNPFGLPLYDRQLNLYYGLYIGHTYMDGDPKVITWSAIC